MGSEALIAPSPTILLLENFSDVLFAFSLLLLVGNTRVAWGEKRIPVAVLLIFCFEALNFVVVVANPSSNHIQVLVEALNNIPATLHRSPINIGLFLVKHIRQVYEIMFAFTLFFISVALFGSHLQSAAIQALFPSEEPKDEAKGEESKQIEDKPERPVTRRRDGGKLFLNAVLISAAALLGLSWLSLPRGSQPATFSDILQLVPKCMPAKFGFFSLVRIILMLKVERTWMYLPDIGSSPRGTTAGQSILVYGAAVVTTMLTWLVESREVGLQMWIRNSSVQKQVYLATVVLHLVVIGFSFLPSFIKMHPLFTTIFIGAVAVGLGAVQSKEFVDATGLGLREINMNMSVATAITLGIIGILCGPIFILVLILTGAAILNSEVVSQYSSPI